MPQHPIAATVAADPSGNQKQIKVDASGNLILAATTSAGNSSKNYAANNAGDLIKTGAGVVRSLIVNTGGTTSTAVLYDGLTSAGTKLGTFSTLAAGALPLNIAFTTGLFVVLAGGAAADVTVTYS